MTSRSEFESRVDDDQVMSPHARPDRACDDSNVSEYSRIRLFNQKSITFIKIKYSISVRDGNITLDFGTQLADVGIDDRGH
jgi:hypothetical protein